MNDLAGVPVIKPGQYDDTHVPWEAIRAVCASNEYNLTRRRLLREWNHCEDDEDIRWKQLKKTKEGQSHGTGNPRRPLK